MNKKLLAFLIVVPLAIILVIGILYAALTQRDVDIPVASVSFTSDYVNLDVTGATVAEPVTYQLEWTFGPNNVRPAPSVVFEVVGTPRANISVSETGLITAFEDLGGMRNLDITLRISTVVTNIHSVVRSDLINIHTFSETPVGITLNTNLELDQAQTNPNFTIEGYTTIEGNVNTFYQFLAAGTPISISVSSYDDLEYDLYGNTFTPREPGIFELEITQNGTTTVLIFNAVHSITLVTLPPQLAALGQVDEYLVGTGNEFVFNFTAFSGPFIITNPNIRVLARVGTTEEFTTATYYDGTFTVSDILEFEMEYRQVQFLTSGQVVTLRVESALDSTIGTQYIFTINNGYNANNHEQLVELFNEFSDYKQDLINITNNIEAVLPAHLMRGSYMRAMHQDAICPDASGHHRVGFDAIYRRGTQGFVLNGNHHEISARNVPLRHADNQVQNWDGTWHDRDRHTNTAPAIFQFGLYANGPAPFGRPGGGHWNWSDDPNVNQYHPANFMEEQRARMLEFYTQAANNRQVINNLVLVGNTENWHMDGGDFLGFRGINGIAPATSNFELNNVDISGMQFGIRVLQRAFEALLDNVTVHNCSGYGMYLHRVTAVTIRNTTWRNLGHAAIFINPAHSSLLVDSVTPNGEEFTLDRPIWDGINNNNNPAFGPLPELNGNPVRIEGTFLLDNWHAGNNPFIQLGNAAMAMLPTQVKTTVFATLGTNATLMLRNMPTAAPEHLAASEFNFGIMMAANYGPTEHHMRPMNQLIFEDALYANTTNHNPTLFWQMVASGNPAVPAPMRVPFNTTNFEISKAIVSQDEAVTSSLVAASVNLSRAGMPFLDWLSFFYLGVNPDAVSASSAPLSHDITEDFFYATTFKSTPSSRNY
ncbi:MAG: right-handed parallel beta-helix repeat-containing protein [Firmicutes bacterium]|nr:right-handed parallel beta-helix repeat-containing protein [Bacillota bacterium]